MSTLNSYIEQLNTALSLLSQRWHATETVWSDPVSQNFEHEYLVPIMTDTQSVLRELQSLERVIAEAKRKVK